MTLTEAGPPAPPGVAHTNGDATAGGPRPLRRHRGLPNSRALVGGVLVAAAAIGLFAAYLRVGGGPDQSYVVARRAVAAGTRLQAADLTVQRMELPASSQARAFADVSAVAGATLVSPLAAGELVQASAVVAHQGEQPSREVTFPVERNQISPSLRQGERVDVLATFSSGDEAVTSSVLRQALVVALQGDEGSVGGGRAVVVTLSLGDEASAVALAHALKEGKVTVVRATGAPSETGPPPSHRSTSAGGAPGARTAGS